MTKVVPQSNYTTTTPPSNYPTTYSQRHSHTHSVLHSHQASHLMRRPPGLTTTSSAVSSPHMDEHRQQQHHHHHSLSLSPSMQMQYPINHHHQQHIPHDQHHAQQHSYSGHMPLHPTPISPGASMNMLSISSTSTSGQSLEFASPLPGSSSSSSLSSSHSTNGSYIPRSPTDQLQDGGGYPQSANNNSSYTDANVNEDGGMYASSASLLFLFSYLRDAPLLGSARCIDLFGSVGFRGASLAPHQHERE